MFYMNAQDKIDLNAWNLNVKIVKFVFVGFLHAFFRFYYVFGGTFVSILML